MGKQKQKSFLLCALALVLALSVLALAGCGGANKDAVDMLVGTWTQKADKNSQVIITKDKKIQTVKIIEGVKTPLALLNYELGETNEFDTNNTFKLVGEGGSPTEDAHYNISKDGKTLKIIEPSVDAKGKKTSLTLEFTRTSDTATLAKTLTSTATTPSAANRPKTDGASPDKK